MTKRIVCLSSGRMPQYKLDILRVLALPAGARIQFRYGEEIVERQLRDGLARNSLTGRAVLIGHVDANASMRLTDDYCPITLCRAGRLTETGRFGSYYVVQFSVDDFVVLTDWKSNQILFGLDRPRGIKGGVAATDDDALDGLWCFETELPVEKEPSRDAQQMWEAAVIQLARSPDFSAQPFFFAVQGLFKRAVEAVTYAPLLHGTYSLDSQSEYDVRVLHWHPKGDKHKMQPPAAVMTVRADPPALRALTSSQLPVDSPYDLKSFRIRSEASTKGEFSSIVVRAETSDAKPLADFPELYLPVRIKPSYRRALWTLAGLALLLWLQQFVPIVLKGEQSWGIAVSTILLAVLIAAVVVFGLKKPI